MTAVLLVILAAAIVGVALNVHKRSPQALLADPSEKTENVQTLVKVGEVSYFGFGPLGAHGSSPIHIVSAEMLGVPDGMRVEGFYFVSVRDVRNSPLGATTAIRPHLRPVDSVTFRRPSDDKWWTLMVGAWVTRPGKFRTKGFRVCYTVGGRDGCETYLNQIVGFDIGTHQE